MIIFSALWSKTTDVQSIFFTELYRKVRKSTVDLKFLPRPISKPVLKIPHFRLLSLSVKLLMGSIGFCCLSDDKSRVMAEAKIYRSITKYFSFNFIANSLFIHIIWKRKVCWIQKYILCRIRIMITEVATLNPFQWSKWPISILKVQNGHVTHQIEARKARITLRIFSIENFARVTLFCQKLIFWNFWPMTS